MIGGFLLLYILLHVGFSAYVTNENLAFFQTNSVENLEVSMLQGEVRTFYSNSEIDQLLQRYETNFPSIIKQRISVGKTIGGNDIWAIQIAKDYNTSRLSRNYADENFLFSRRLLEQSLTKDDALFLETHVSRKLYTNDYAQRPTILLTGQHRGSEVMASTMIMYLIKRLIKGYVDSNADISYLLETRNLWFIPVIDKDTYEVIKTTYETNGSLPTLLKDRDTSACPSGNLGVNLRLNYPTTGTANAVSDSCSDSYGGASPLSQSESIAINNFVQQHPPNLMLNIGAYSGVVYLPFSYLPYNDISQSAYRSVGDDVLFNNLFLNYLNHPTIKIGTSYQKFQQTSAGEISDYFYHDKGIPAFTVELGTQSLTTRTYYPTPSDARNILSAYYSFFVNLMYRTGPIFAFSTVYQKIEGCQDSTSSFLNCSTEKDFVYSAKFTLTNMGLTASGAQHILIRYSSALALTNVSVSLNKTQNYAFLDQNFTNLNFTVENNANGNGIQFVQVPVDSLVPRGNAYISLIGKLPSLTVSNAHISFEVLYTNTAQDSQYYQVSIKTEGTVETQTKPNVNSSGKSKARMAQDIILIIYFSTLGIVALGIGIRKLIVRKSVAKSLGT